MSEVPVKKKHQVVQKNVKSGKSNKISNEQLKKTQNLFKLGFSCESKEHDSLSTCSASHTMAADPIEVPCEPFEQIGQDQETPKLTNLGVSSAPTGAEESEAETEVIHQNVVHLENHKGEELATEILIFLSQYNIDVRNLRGQSYDNTSNMPGCYNGLQAHIKKINHLTHYVPCAAHSLNLVGVRAAESWVGAISFFEFVQALYNFFSASTHRWAIMLKHLEKGDERKQDSSLVLKTCAKKKRHHDDGAAEEVVFRGKEKLKVDTYLPVLDMLCTELSRRLEAYREINNLFGFLTDFSTKSDVEIRQACTKFKEHYFEDIEPEFIDEMVQYKYFILQLEDAGKKIMPAEKSYKLIIAKKYIRKLEEGRGAPRRALPRGLDMHNPALH
ncbi:hypothetical protein EVAR_6352_1 [Eumeta japonica]|uniref:Zinc finger MYM-type protein 1 n=1 Tax=Eumeta variegata TaxID=151549 RepID=A0A4C1TFH7_EUMVA|nr:hypothetical protein EVAR_6352_1 [Eumeta japonica]